MAAVLLSRRISRPRPGLTSKLGSLFLEEGFSLALSTLADRPSLQPLVERMATRAMGLRCTICNHPARPQIDLAIATGLSKRAVAQRFQVSRDAVWRHAQAHLTAEMRAALATKLLQREGDTRRILLEEGVGVAEALKAIRGSLFGLFLVAVDTGDSRAAAALSRPAARKPSPDFSYRTGFRAAVNRPMAEPIKRAVVVG